MSHSITMLSLPQSFTALRDILDGNVGVGRKVNVIGLVTDFRVPTATKGTDWKSQLKLYDISCQDEDKLVLSFNIFRPQSEMPSFKCGDVVVLHQANVQKYQMGLSLVTHHVTQIHIYEASKIPKPPGDALCALRPPTRENKPPNKAVNEFVSYFYHHVDKCHVPDENEFEVMKIQSANIKDKFSLLKDVKEGKFYDITVQVVKEPYDMGSTITLWVSDYTENPAFFHRSFNGGDGGGGDGDLPEDPDGDPFGYGAKYRRTSTPPKEWSGPFGKRSMQITCFEPHATAIRDCKILLGSWVSIRNLQIKYGRNVSNLEGFLREDRAAAAPKINIWPLDPTEDPENIPPQLKEAIRRKRDYEKAKKEALRDITDAAMAGQKRRANQALESEPKKENAKARRRRTRQAQAIEAQQKEADTVEAPDLNSAVKCENEDRPLSTVKDILEPIHYGITIDENEVKLPIPFTNANYRACVRVVDFMPAQLEDFAHPKKTSEFDVLSDNEDDNSGSDSGSDSVSVMMSEPRESPEWEWKFYLQVEDAAAPNELQKERIWVAVDNAAAQCLVSLDASDLRRDRKNLELLRERLFTLWGNLEEHKTQEREAKERSLRAGRGNQPPAGSSDNEEEGQQAKKTPDVSNRPFSCCIRQYGIRVRERDAKKADAGEGRRWERMYSLFGTRVSTMQGI